MGSSRGTVTTSGMDGLVWTGLMFVTLLLTFRPIDPSLPEGGEGHTNPTEPNRKWHSPHSDLRWLGLWMEQAEGISLENIVRLGKPMMHPNDLLDIMHDR